VPSFRGCPHMIWRRLFRYRWDFHHLFTFKKKTILYTFNYVKFEVLCGSKNASSNIMQFFLHTKRINVETIYTCTTMLRIHWPNLVCIYRLSFSLASVTFYFDFRSINSCLILCSLNRILLFFIICSFETAIPVATKLNVCWNDIHDVCEYTRFSFGALSEPFLMTVWFALFSSDHSKFKLRNYFFSITTTQTHKSTDNFCNLIH